MNQIKLIECPRDAMQGIKEFIPTGTKINYLNTLLKVGFEVIDCGSFVSSKAIPQMADTADVISNLNKTDTETRISVIVANVRGAQEAIQHNNIDILGFPFSLSETFQQRNTNASIEDAMIRIEAIQKLCINNNKELLLYFSMGFGNPYNDPWNTEIIANYVEQFNEMGIRNFSIADTVGMAKAEDISYVFNFLTTNYPDLNFSAHFHAHPEHWREKIEAAYNSGCKRFEGALKGLGGCPMAKDDMVGNIATENLIRFFQEKNISLNLNKSSLENALNLSLETFPQFSQI